MSTGTLHSAPPTTRAAHPGTAARRRLMPHGFLGRALQRAFVYLLLCLGAAALLFPLWWMVVVSLAPEGGAAAAMTSAETFEWWPRDPRWANYPEALAKMGAAKAGAARWLGFVNAAANTIVITTLCVLGQILSCSLVGYAFARLRFRGRPYAFILMISTMMLPPQVTMIPLFILFRNLGWIDTILPLVVPAFFGTPFFIFMFRQFFSQIPEDLLDAARIDGANQVVIWARIMLPMCKPVIAITAIFTFVATWNDFLNPLIYLHSERNYTLAVALASFQNQYSRVADVQLLMAAALVTMLPCIILFFVAQRQFVRGLNLGAVKG